MKLQVGSRTEYRRNAMSLLISKNKTIGGIDCKDITDVLGYQNASKALVDHVDEDDKLNNETLSSLGQRGGWLINESGLYSLILGSKLETAKKFKRWVTSEVLPSIRKTGSYEIPKSKANAERLASINNAVIVRNRQVIKKKNCA